MSNAARATALEARRLGLTHAAAAERAGVTEAILRAWLTNPDPGLLTWQRDYRAAEHAYELALRAHALNHAKADGHVAVGLLKLHLAEARERTRDKTRRATERATLALKRVELNRGTPGGVTITDARAAIAAAIAALTDDPTEE